MIHTFTAPVHMCDRMWHWHHFYNSTKLLFEERGHKKKWQSILSFVIIVGFCFFSVCCCIYFISLWDYGRLAEGAWCLCTKSSNKWKWFLQASQWSEPVRQTVSYFVLIAAQSSDKISNWNKDVRFGWASKNRKAKSEKRKTIRLISSAMSIRNTLCILTSSEFQRARVTHHLHHEPSDTHSNIYEYGAL